MELRIDTRTCEEECAELRDEVASLRERAEKAEAELTRIEQQYEAVIADMLARWQRAQAVVNVAREFRLWCANGYGMYANAIKPICAAIDAYDARAEEAE